MSIIRNSKPHEDMPDFDEMMNEVNEEIQEKDAEQDIINRVPQLKELSANIDQATNTWRVPPLNWKEPSSNTTEPRGNWTLLLQTSVARLIISMSISTM